MDDEVWSDIELTDAQDEDLWLERTRALKRPRLVVPPPEKEPEPEVQIQDVLDLEPGKDKGRFRNFVWTLNNYTDKDIERMKEFAKACLYMVFGKEVGKNGTKHLQGCTMLGKQLSGKTLRSHPYPFKKCALFIMRGTPDQAADYCKKDGDYFEFGECPRVGKKNAQGQRSDLLKATELIKEGKTDAEISELLPLVTFKYLRHIRDFRGLTVPKRTTPLTVELYYGTPGSGKTYRARHENPDLFQIPVGKGVWFTGYQGQKVVLIDDFAGHIGLSQLLQILDEYPIQLETKGGHVWWCPTKVIVTTNVHPCNWYNYEQRQDSYDALARRFKKVWKMNVVDYEREASEEDVHNFFYYQKVEKVVVTDHLNK